MSIPHWRDGSWDRIYLGGKLLPGRVAALTVTPARAVQKVRPKGSDGPQLKDEGYDGATVDLELEIWTGPQPVGDYQLTLLAAALAEMSPKRPGATASPLEVLHPITSAAGVLNVYIASYSLAMPAKGGKLRVPIKLLEWFAPESTKPSAQGGASKGGASGGTGDGGPIDNGSVPAPDPENLGPAFP